MKLIPNIRSKARAYSFWALLLSLVLFLTPEFYLAYFGDNIASPYLVGGAALFLGVFGLLGWSIDQAMPSLLRTAKVIVLSAVISAAIYLLLALPSYAMGQKPVADQPTPSSTAVTYADTSKVLVSLVKRWEGMHACGDDRALHCSYLDQIASPPLWTVCYGHTGTAARGQRFDEPHCAALLRGDLKSYWAGVRRGFTPDTIATRLTPQRDAAFASLGYNAGVGAVRGSTATRRLNAGDVVGGCKALTWWNKAGGRVVRGLVNRRTEEYELCMRGAS